MPETPRPCHGQYSVLVEASFPRKLTYVRKFLWEAREHGLDAAVRRTMAKIGRLIRMGGDASSEPSTPAKTVLEEEGPPAPAKVQYAPEEVLNLQPGELVEVKSEEEILATLDHRGRQRGLSWMPEMRRFCGKRYRVFKRLGPIVLESTGEHREIKNTVLLEGVMCDGEGFYGCTRSCFHFWREVWLERVDETG